MEIVTNESKKNYKELLPQVVDRIFLTCKNDPSFHLKDEIEIIENKIQALLKKIEKQEYFFKESEKIKADLQQRIEVLENENNTKQTELLEELGSEI